MLGYWRRRLCLCCPPLAFGVGWVRREWCIGPTMSLLNSLSSGINSFGQKHHESFSSDFCTLYAESPEMKQENGRKVSVSVILICLLPFHPDRVLERWSVTVLCRRLRWGRGGDRGYASSGSCYPRKWRDQRYVDGQRGGNCHGR